MPQAQAESNDGPSSDQITISFIRPIGLLFPPFLPMAPMTFIRIVSFGEEERQGSPVSDDKF
jgi:hypothetical protein